VGNNPWESSLYGKGAASAPILPIKTGSVGSSLFFIFPFLSLIKVHVRSHPKEVPTLPPSFVGYHRDARDRDQGVVM
jgi:hypothetical protein